MKTCIFTLAISTCLISILTGCATLEQPEAYNVEDQLAVCGFKQALADTPAKLNKLKALPQRKIVLREHNGTNYYIYANAHQKCIFIGNQKAYQNYQKSKFQKQIVDNNLYADTENEAAASADETEEFDWDIDDMWAPWMYY